MQSRIDSLMEALTNVAIGFGINFAANVAILPLVLGVPVHLSALGLIGLLYTIISVTRSYLLRRAFNGKSAWQALKDRFDPPLLVEAMDCTWRVRRSKLTPMMKADIASGFATVVRDR